MGCLLLACLCIRLHRVPAHLNSYLQYRGKTERAKRSNDKTTKQNYKATRTLARSGQKNAQTKKGKLHKKKVNCTNKRKLYKNASRRYRICWQWDKVFSAQVRCHFGSSASKKSASFLDKEALRRSACQSGAERLLLSAERLNQALSV